MLWTKTTLVLQKGDEVDVVGDVPLHGLLLAVDAQTGDRAWLVTCEHRTSSVLSARLVASLPSLPLPACAAKSSGDACAGNHLISLPTPLGIMQAPSRDLICRFQQITAGCPAESMKLYEPL